jgi:hypothetical protein
MIVSATQFEPQACKQNTTSSRLLSCTFHNLLAVQQFTRDAARSRGNSKLIDVFHLQLKRRRDREFQPDRPYLAYASPQQLQTLPPPETAKIISGSRLARVALSARAVTEVLSPIETV